MKKLLFALLAASVALFSSCDEVEIPSTLVIPEESIAYFQDGIGFFATSDEGVLTVGLAFTATLDWSVRIVDLKDDKPATWLTVEPSSGTAGETRIIITAQDNRSEDPRSARLTVSCGAYTKSLDIVQAGLKSASSVTVELDKNSAELTVGQTLQLTATARTDDPVASKIEWSSSNPDVATVTTEGVVAVDGTYIPAGLVTAVSEGEAVITAKVGDAEASCKIKVVGKPQADGLIITPDKVTILKNEKLQLSVTDATGAPVKATWTTTDRMVAVVDDNNMLEARNPGSAVVTATADGKTGTCEVTVTDEVAVQSIAFDPDYIEMNVGDERQLNVVFTPENATHKTINVWTVDGGNPSVSVDDKGVVKALIAGRTAVVIAAINPELIARCTIKIVDPENPDIPVESIALDKTEATVYAKSEPLILTATVTPQNALQGKAIAWKSTNPTKVLVESINATQAKVAGLVAGSKETVTAYLGDKSASCEVTVQNPPTVDVTGITLDKASLELARYQSYILTATVTPDNATDKTVTWSSTNPNVARVANEGDFGADGSIAQAGTVMAISAGNAVITATAGGKSASCNVTVTDNTVAVTQIRLNNNKLELEIGQTGSLTATVLPDNATNKNVTWLSSNTSVVLVSNGTVRGVAAGSATITVSSVSNPEITATCAVTVKEAAPVEAEAVDLGLPSGLKWCSMNVGASKPEDYGNYYAWAETSPKTSYTSSNYKYPATSYSDGITIYKKYDTILGGDGKTVLEPEDDAATANLGNGWRTPTFNEFKELRENCTWTWKDNYNGVKGMLVTGPNGNSIFLPAGGWYDERSLKNKGSYGSYWTATGERETANAVDFINSDKDKALVPRYQGRSVRPVKD